MKRLIRYWWIIALLAIVPIFCASLGETEVVQVRIIQINEAGWQCLGGKATLLQGPDGMRGLECGEWGSPGDTVTASRTRGSFWMSRNQFHMR